MRFRAIIVGGIICITIVTSASYVLTNALAGENNIDLLTSMLIPCTDKPYATSSRMVALRLDDVQAYAFADATERTMNDALSRGIPLVLGVIPNHLRDDQVLYKYLRANRCSVEFAVHGWDHIEPVPGKGEFAFLDQAEAEKRLSNGREVIERLSRESVGAFIPPNNEYSTSTAMALIKLKFDRVSAYEREYLDVDASMVDFTIDRFGSAANVVQTCEARYVQGDDLCTVMLHPQDFVTDGVLDEAKYAEYLKMLVLFQDAGVAFVRFEDVVKKVPIRESATFGLTGE
jgi:predicted deacetylase